MDRAEPPPDEPVGPPIVLPPHPPEPGPTGFPLLATVAPVAGALVLWMVTGSAISLAFAALGPLVAAASVLDARRQARRIRRRAVVERAAQLEALRAEIAERHAVERLHAWRRAPAARGLVETSAAADWRDAAPGAVVIGRGDTASAVRVEGTPMDAADRALLERAIRLEGAPVQVHASLGIGIVGPPALARGAARGVLLQLAHRCRPDVVGLEVPDDPEWSWARRLPHHGGSDVVIRVVDAAGASPGRLRRGPAARGTPAGSTTPAMPIRAVPIRPTGAAIAVAAVPTALPPGLATIVQVSGHGTATLDRRGAGGTAMSIVPEVVGLAEAAAWAERMRASAARDGYVLDAALAAEVALGELEQHVDEPSSRASLRVRVGLGHDGPVDLDLVAGGPHAIVAGTTGSGKSEFLLAWLAALAGVYPPDRVAFLLVDFKGGAAFEPLRGLPHVAGIVTDLDESEAERAVLSLRAELRHRESVLRDERVRDLVELGPRVDLARLVIVVDEFQAMIERFPDLGAIIADIAARGRSLGVHLVLASQRPNGVVREQVSANAPIRVSFRVMQRADSIAVIGTDAAAAIRSDTPGRGVIDVGDGVPVVFQSARVDPASLDRLRIAHAGTTPSRRPWQDPLPTRLAPDELDRAVASARLEPGALPFGLVDVPERQRHDVLAWSPAIDGHLLVLGAPGSGRSVTLAAIARAVERDPRPLEVTRLNGPRSRRWDVLQATWHGFARRDRSWSCCSSWTTSTRPSATGPTIIGMRRSRPWRRSCGTGAAPASSWPRAQGSRTGWARGSARPSGSTCCCVMRAEPTSCTPVEQATCGGPTNRQERVSGRRTGRRSSMPRTSSTTAIRRPSRCRSATACSPWSPPPRGRISSRSWRRVSRRCCSSPPETPPCGRSSPARAPTRGGRAS